jgi:hypothetical protein
MSRLLRVLLVVGLLGGAAVLPVASVSAAELGVGQAVEITGASDVGATIWGLLQGVGGKLLAAYMVGRGLGQLTSDRQGGRPGVTIATGVGVAFVPHVVGTAFEAAPAATSLAHHGPALSLYDGFFGGRFGQDPVFFLALLLTVLVLELNRRRARQVRRVQVA